MTIAAWESFIESAIFYRAMECAAKYNVPKEVVMELIEGPLNEELKKSNTPDSGNLRRLSKRYIGVDVAACWKWSGINSKTATERLDKLIKTRGKLAHNARGLRWTSGRGKTEILRKTVVDGIELIERLYRCTQKAFEMMPREL